MALGLAREGATVVATASRAVAELQSTVAASEGGQILAVQADVTKPEDCARVVEAALAQGGRLDMLVNNAGRGMRYVSESFLTEPTRFWETDPEVWRMVVDTNVNGPFLMARTCVPVMIAAGWGRIVNISMNHATMRRAGFSPYGPSKAALESETIIWAQDLAGTGVTVNALLPGGATITGMIPEGVDPALKRNLLDPSVMVPPLIWLASLGADGVTGTRFDASVWASLRQSGQDEAGAARVCGQAL